MNPTTARAFSDELVKIAASKKNKLDRASEAVARGAAGIAGAQLATSALGNLALSPSKTPATVQDVAQMQKHMKVRGSVQVGRGADSFMPSLAPRGSFAQPQELTGKPSRIYLGPGAGEAIAAHEMGHIKNWQQAGGSRFRRGLVRAINKPARTSLGRISPLVSMGYSAGAEDPSYAPAAANAALFAPALVDEAAASGRAAGYLMKRHGTMKGLARSGKLLPAFGTYALAAGAPAAMVAARRHFKKKQKAKEMA